MSKSKNTVLTILTSIAVMSASVILLAGCTSVSGTNKTAPTNTPFSKANIDQRYLSLVDQSSEAKKLGQQKLLTMGEYVCSQAPGGRVTPAVLQELPSKYGVSATVAADVFSAANNTLCLLTAQSHAPTVGHGNTPVPVAPTVKP